MLQNESGKMYRSFTKPLWNVECKRALTLFYAETNLEKPSDEEHSMFLQNTSHIAKK